MTRITTERLTLRRPEAGDVEPFITYLGSDRMAWLGGALERSEAWKMVAAVMGHWDIRGYGLFVISEGDRPIGAVGPQFPEGWPEPEIAWHIWHKADEGRGYAREAAEAARDHAFGPLGWETAVSYVHEGNVRSRALAERLGATADAAAAQFLPGFITYRHRTEGAKA